MRPEPSPDHQFRGTQQPQHHQEMKTKSTTVTVQTPTGESIRMALPPAVWEGGVKCSTGITRTGLYVGPRSKRVVARHYSIWEDRQTHCCIGERFSLIEDPDTLARLAGEHQELADALEAAAILIPESL